MGSWFGFDDVRSLSFSLHSGAVSFSVLGFSKAAKGIHVSLTLSSLTLLSLSFSLILLVTYGSSRSLIVHPILLLSLYVV